MKHLFIAFFVFLCIQSSSQTIEQIKADSIKAALHLYYWGEGSGTTNKAAEQEALAIIIEQIFMQVESNFEQSKIETTGEKLKETVSDVIKTYSNATLKNTERIVIREEPDAKIFRYIKRSEVAKIFESRKNKIIELAQNGVMALESLQIADALRYFYWSQTLLRSHPESSEIRLQDKSGNNMLLLYWLPMQINQIMANLSMAVDTVEVQDGFKTYVINIQYKNEPVSNCDSTYNSGMDWTIIVIPTNGMGT